MGRMFGHAADYKSAIRQIENLRYERWERPGRSFFVANARAHDALRGAVGRLIERGFQQPMPLEALDHIVGVDHQIGNLCQDESIGL